MKTILATLFTILTTIGYGQENSLDSNTIYKKRVLESAEVDFLSSYYVQKGKNAAVSGGIGTEKLTDITPTIVISIPLNDDDVLTIDAEVSAYTSASSSNINPFDGHGAADPFVQSSGASISDVWNNETMSFSHNSDDRNKIWTAKASVSTEYDYLSIGFGGSFTHLYNEKNTEISVSTNIFLDTWYPVYPVELLPAGAGGDENDFNINYYTITGNSYYNPSFTYLSNTKRKSYSVSFGFSQIITKHLQDYISTDLILQKGLLSTPFHRVYFSDIGNSYIENFQLADAIERLPNSRYKLAIGNRLNYYINENFVLRTFYRYYLDNWGILSNTALIELPIKIADKFTLYPSYRFYIQTSANYFAPYEQHLSTEKVYTSDYDLSEFFSNQYGFGITYTDIFTKFHVWRFGLKSIDLKYDYYKRNTGFNANIIATSIKFVFD